MYKFKHAVRVEANNNWSKQLTAILAEPLPPRVSFEGTNQHGSWFRVELPASVWALAIRSDSGTSVGVYHSPWLLDQELKEALNVPSKKATA